MPLKVAVQMDPIERINIRGDSTFALLLEAQRRGHALAYYTPDRLALTGGQLFARRARSQGARPGRGSFHAWARRGAPSSTNSTWCCCARTRRSISPMSPPRICSSASCRKHLVVNDPAQVRNAPEKLFVMEFPDLMPPTLVTRDLAEIKAFRAEHGDIVMKPLYGNGGEAVFRLAPEDLNFGSLYDLFAVTFREAWVVQKFLPAVREGDKRIILVDGEFGGAVNRVPAADDLRSNLVRGGAAEATDLTAREREICARIGPSLRERGLLFVGIDVIDGFLTEINVTSPTGIRAIKALGGPDVAAMVWDRIEAKRSVAFLHLSHFRTENRIPLFLKMLRSSLAAAATARLHRRREQIVAADPGVLVADDGLHRQGRGRRRDAGAALDRGADRHELDQAAELVDVGLDADHVVGADRIGLVADQADGVLAGVVDERGRAR